MANKSGGFAGLAMHGAENKIGRPIGMLRGLMDANLLGGFAGVLGMNPDDPLFSKIFKMYPHLKAQANTGTPGGGSGGGGNGGGTGGGGPPGGTAWQYPGLLEAPYTTTNWFGKQ